MKIANWAIGVALIGSLASGAAWAQSSQGQSSLTADYGYAEVQASPGQQSAVQQASYGYAEIQDETATSPSDMPATPPPAPGAYGAVPLSAIDNGGACGSGCWNSYGSCGSYAGAACGGCMGCCGLGEPFRLFDRVIGQQNYGIEAGGWISVGGHANEYNATSNGPLGFNNVGDGVNVHQLWFYLGKEADTQGCGVDWGAHMDFVFGVDGPDTQAFRGTQWDVDWDTGRDYGTAIPQAYVELAYDYLTVKAGYFYTLIGYEVVQAPENFFYSHAYTQYYIEPFTHTGALATYDGFENWTFFGGYTTSWDAAFEKINGTDLFLGGATYSPSDDVSLTYMTSAGYFGQTGNDLYMHSIVMDMNLTDRINWVIQSDFHYQNSQGQDLMAAGVNQYMFYKLNECWSIGGRFEWLHDRDGAFVTPGVAAGNFYNLTGGLNWKPNANMVIRPEVRYDWFSGVYQPGNLPFDNGTKDEQVSFGCDVIILF